MEENSNEQYRWSDVKVFLGGREIKGIKPLIVKEELRMHVDKDGNLVSVKNLVIINKGR